MAVLTELGDEERDRIAAVYGMGELHSAIGLADGDVETTFLFRAGEGDFIVTIFESPVEAQELDRAFRSMDALRRAGVPCPATVRTTAGEPAIRIGAKLVAVVGCVDGVSTRTPTPAKCRDLGRHAALTHVTLGREYGEGRSPGRPLPCGWVHGALRPENVFFMGERVTGIINLRRQNWDLFVAEIADLLVHWCATDGGQLDSARLPALLEGYASIRPIGATEYEAIPSFVLAAAAADLARSVFRRPRTGRWRFNPELDRLQLAFRSCAEAIATHSI